MRRLFKALISRLMGRGSASPGCPGFNDLGFHGDRYLLTLVDTLLQSCDYFVETGTNVGSTLAYVAKRYPDVQCFSCEPDETAYGHASKNTSSYNNVELHRATSNDFLKRMLANPSLLNGRVLFWLDAHGSGFQWPLRDEIAMVTQHWNEAYLLIDDFLVPELDCFGHDAYNGQVCSWEYIESSLNPQRDYRLYYPCYTDRTSTHHPLRGWGLIDYGHTGELTLPKSLDGKVRIDEA